MNGNGVSKKVTVFMLVVNSIIGFAANAPNKLPYAILIVVVFVVYLLIRAFTERKKNGKENSTTNEES